jgi:putative NADH-flavin reductase
MKIALLGATGPTSRALIPAVLEQSHQVTIFARNPSKLEATIQKNPNVTIIEGTLDDEAALRRAFHGQDAVISVLGPVPRKPNQVLPKSLQTVFSAMKAEKVTRFVGTGTAVYSDPKDKSSLSYAIAILILRLVASNLYHEVKAYSVTIANEKDVEWTLFRVNHLKDKPKTGKVAFGFVGDGKTTLGGIHRADLAEVLVNEVTDRKWIHQMPIARTA